MKTETITGHELPADGMPDAETTPQDECHRPAVGVPVERMVRPQCWAFAMEFLGEPEAPVVEAYVASLETDIARLRVALKRIARWHGELPDSGRQWPDGQPMSYAAAFGSNGERDYMRQVALDALGPNVGVEPHAPR